MTTNGGTPTNSFGWRNTSFLNTLGKWGEGILSLLFPPHCVICGKPCEGLTPICPDCAAQLPQLEGSRCYICQEELTDPYLDLCTSCGTREREFELARALGPYNSGWGTLVRELKFNKEPAIARFLASKLAEYMQKEKPFGNIDIITYVPMTKADRKARGFNQAKMLARGLGRKLGIPVGQFLAKVRQTSAQVDLPAAERRKNLHGAFEVVTSGQGAVLIVDDIFTTGSTAEECARVLKTGGFARVYVLTVARA